MGEGRGEGVMSARGGALSGVPWDVQDAPVGSHPASSAAPYSWTIFPQVSADADSAIQYCKGLDRTGQYSTLQLWQAIRASPAAPSTWTTSPAVSHPHKTFLFSTLQ